MKKASILIVEDEQIVALDIENTLERYGYQVAGQTDRGDEVIKKVRDLHPDLILMDINLRGTLDGIEAAIQIRARFDLPVIFLTAYGNPAIFERARLAEPFAYIFKPFEERELISNIEMALHKHDMVQKVRASEEKFRSVIQHSSDGIVLAGDQGNVIEWNLAAEQITGLERSTVIGQLLWEVVFRILPQERRLPSAQDALTAQWKEVVNSRYASGLDQLSELEIETPQGVRRIVQSNGFSIETSRGMLGGAIFRDITERKRADLELRKLSQAVGQSANVILITDIEGNIEYVNPKFVELSGYSPSEVIGKNPRILNSGRHGADFYQNLWQTIKAGRVWKGEIQNRRKDGALYWEDSTITPVFDSENKLVNFIAIKEDITARKELAEAERDQRKLAEALRDTSTALNSTLNLDEVLDRVLENIEKVTPFDAAMVLIIEGHAVRKIRQYNKLEKPLNPGITGNTQANLINIPILQEMRKTRQPCLIPDTQADPRWRAIPGMGWIRSFISAPVIIRGKVAGILNILSGIPAFFTHAHVERVSAFTSQVAVAIENAQLFEQAYSLSITDSLTELMNRRHFFEIAKIEFERIQRYHRTLSIMMIDVDHFKKINDEHGHTTGDLALQKVAAQIKHSVRTVDAVARYGGEEFVVLMPETALREALQVAERIRKSVSDGLIEENSVEVWVTLSIGVAEMDKQSSNIDTLIRYADQALYAAKAKGRNRVEYFRNA